MGLHNKNKKITTQTISSKSMAVALSCIARSIVTVVIGVVFTVLGIIGIVECKYALLIDYANGSPVFNCSGFVFVYGVNAIIVGAGVLLTKKLHLLQHLLVFLTLLASHTTLTVIVMICTYNWVVEYGHIPALDAYVREHDRESVCWGGITRLDYNSVRFGANCYKIGELAYCAVCRREYYSDELTFIKSNRFELAFVLILLLALNGYTLWKLHEAYTTPYYHCRDDEDDAKSTTTILQSSTPTVDGHYAVPKNNKPVATAPTAIPSSFSSFKHSPTVTYWHNDEESLLLPPPPKSWIFDQN
ncbi:actin rearranging factor 1 [Alphabaculovirus altersperidaniae]|uniref:Actin rearranging factor 1 n=1 Tax=Spodoptera eridania nucleopolyhedrovirus TaxID=2315721 RepID=A0ABX6TR85_9ABAC|nr:actin rearranging factor 1 [Spodoptera eridania nucleopolyhedrovirus]QNV47862.1 actin rearranging factor 1 [Spodoptera eridania nucleopolyhedrovirus]